MLSKETLPFLKDGKNLLAFSGGVDSTALFFLLLREKIPFDIAIVNYQTREQSSEEVAYAKEPAVLPEPGFFLPCCTRPVSDVVVDL